MGWRHFGRGLRRFQRFSRHFRPIPPGRNRLALGRALGSLPDLIRRHEEREWQDRQAWATAPPDPVSGLMRTVAPATWRMPVSCDFVFRRLSVTLSRARLVAAAVSAHEARFDPATERNNSTGFDFLKAIFQRMRCAVWRPGRSSVALLSRIHISAALAARL
jgi:hypothetical protein